MTAPMLNLVENIHGISHLGLMHDSLIKIKDRMEVENFPTPCYYYDLSILQRTIDAMISAKNENHDIYYAVKANHNPRILKTMLANGFGADCVSGNEIKQVISLGFEPQHIVYAGVGKTDEELLYAMNVNVKTIHVESLSELKVLAELSEISNNTTQIGLRINPDVNAHTHPHITTGLRGNKFGINESDLSQAFEIIRQSEHLNFNALHFHVGSQITEMNVFKELSIKVNSLVPYVSGAGFNIKYVNLGGGLGIDYDDPMNNLIPAFDSYFNTFQRHLKLHNEIRLGFEPGRSLVGQCGFLISKVLHIKEFGENLMLVIDGGMTDLIRPALYGAKHKIFNVSSYGNSILSKNYEVVGPVCESADSFGTNHIMEECSRNNTLAIASSGAYGEAMASGYNLRRKPQVFFQG